jgi:ribose/xylose/arabinose/galactoside ABC-type transport system permease subunit
MTIMGAVFVSYLQSIEFIPYGFLYWMIVGLLIGMVVGALNGAFVETTFFNYKFEQNESTFLNAS